MSGRFSVEIRRSDDHYLVRLESGFRTRAEAEAIAARRRDEIERRGWSMYVSIDEAHEVVRPPARAC